MEEVFNTLIFTLHQVRYLFSAILDFYTFYLGPLTESVLTIVESKKILALEDVQYLHSVSILYYAGIINFFLLLSAALVAVFKPWKKSSTR